MGKSRWKRQLAVGVIAAALVRRLEDGVMYPVRVGEVLASLQHQVETALRQQCQDLPALVV